MNVPAGSSRTAKTQKPEQLRKARLVRREPAGGAGGHAACASVGGALRQRSVHVAERRRRLSEQGCTVATKQSA